MRGLALLLGVALILGALWGGAYGEHVLNPVPVEAGAKVVCHWATLPLVLTCLAGAIFGGICVIVALNDDCWPWP